MKKFYVKERHNPQTSVYYTLCGQLSKREAEKKENPSYGINIMHGFDTQEKYEQFIEQLKADKKRIL